jgi:maleate isomerase
MTNVLGWRRIFAVLAPSTNTTVEADFARLRVPGVTSHMGRIHIHDQDLSSDKSFEALLDQIRAEIDAATARVLTCEPDFLVMGMSAETFWGGVAGNREFTRHMREVSGLEVTTGANACDRALRLYGAHRIGVITPYQPIGDENVRLFFSESGFEVVAVEGLKCPTAASISEVPEKRLREAITSLALLDVDAIVQVGTNLSMVGLADEAERWIEKPVIAINAATWWAALRDNGIDDKIYGAGDLLRNH